jgi:hypothetical protein
MKKIKKIYIKHKKIKPLLMMAFLINFNRFFMISSESQPSVIDIDGMNDSLDYKKESISKVASEDNLASENYVASEDDVTTKKDVASEGDVTTKKDVASEGDVASENDVTTKKDVASEKDLTTEHDVASENDVTNENDLASENDVTSQDCTNNHETKRKKKRNAIIGSIVGIGGGLGALGILGLGINSNSGKKQKKEKVNEEKIANPKKPLVISQEKVKKIKKAIEKKMEQKILPIYDQFNSLKLTLDKNKEVDNETIKKLKNLEYDFLKNGWGYIINQSDKERVSTWIRDKKEELSKQIKLLLENNFNDQCFHYKSCRFTNVKDRSIFIINDNVSFSNGCYGKNTKIIDMPSSTNDENLFLSTQLKLYNLILKKINHNKKESNYMSSQIKELTRIKNNYFHHPTESSWDKLDKIFNKIIEAYDKENKQNENKSKNKPSSELVQLISEILSFKEKTLDILKKKMNDLKPFLSDQNAITQINKIPSLFKKITFYEKLSSAVENNLIKEIKKIKDIKNLYDWNIISTETGLIFNIENDKGQIQEKFDLNKNSTTFPSKFIKLLIDKYSEICCKDEQFRDLFKIQFKKKIFQGNLYKGLDDSNIDLDNSEITTLNVENKFYFLMAIFTIMSNNNEQRKNDTLLSKYVRNNKKSIVYNKSISLLFWRRLVLTIEFNGSSLLIHKRRDVSTTTQEISIINTNGKYKLNLTKEDIKILNDLKNDDIKNDNGFISYIYDTDSKSFDMDSLKIAIIKGLNKNNPNIQQNRLQRKNQITDSD